MSEINENINNVESQNIVEVRDLKKYYLLKKEWKLVTRERKESPSDTAAEKVPEPETNVSDVSPETVEDAESAEKAQRFSRKPALVKSFVKAVDGVSFDIPKSKTMGLVGESGCGKSTLGRSILRLHEITSGSVKFNGQEITTMSSAQMRKIRPKMQIVFQDPYSSLPPRLPIGDIIGEAVKVHNIVPKSDYRDYVIDVMQKCGLRDFHYDRYPHEFSGGQRQRVCIARALALKPEFVVCDEPVSALDVSIQAQIVNLLKTLQRDLKLTYLFISHDLSVVEHISDSVGVMYLGNFVEMGDIKDIFNDPMHPYTVALLSAVPMPDPHYKSKRIILQGDIPSPANPPKGCKFHTRCSKCMDICKEVAPKLIDYGNGHKCACHLYPQQTPDDRSK